MPLSSDTEARKKQFANLTRTTFTLEMVKERGEKQWTNPDGTPFFDYSEAKLFWRVLPSGKKQRMIEFRCPNHEVVTSVVDKHLNPEKGKKANGCPECGKSMRSRKKLDKILADCRRAHPDADYDYSRIVEGHVRAKQWIYCRTHKKWFQQSLGNHCQGQTGCEGCIEDKNGANGLPLVEYLKKVYAKFGYAQFDYPHIEDEYVNMTKMEITVVCKDHGSFTVLPIYHLAAATGCNDCGNERIGQNHIEEARAKFIPEAQAKHPGKYRYDRVAYIDARTPIEIFCNTCGRHFPQTPNDHLNSRGCPSCAPHGYNPSKPGILYIRRFCADDGSITFSKCGKTNENGKTKDSTQRMVQLDNQTVNGITYLMDQEMVFEYQSEDGALISDLEKKVHEAFKDRQFTGLLDTSFDGRTELFEASVHDEMVAFVENAC